MILVPYISAAVKSELFRPGWTWDFSTIFMIRDIRDFLLSTGACFY